MAISGHTPRAFLCDAFADGLNYFLERNPQIKPRLIGRFEAWQTIALMRFCGTSE